MRRVLRWLERRSMVSPELPTYGDQPAPMELAISRDLGLSLARRHRLLARVQQQVLEAQADNHGMLRPGGSVTSRAGRIAANAHVVSDPPGSQFGSFLRWPHAALDLCRARQHFGKASWHAADRPGLWS